MSLLTFHRGLIAVSIAFCFGYGMWEAARFLRLGESGHLLVGGLFLFLGIGLAWYLARLNQILGYSPREE
jgi:hypothetical protein